MAKVERHFAGVWALVTLMAIVAALPLENVGLGLYWWPVVAGQITAIGLGIFAGAEWTSGGVKTGYSGSYTSWVFYHITNAFIRVAFGVGLALVIFWRLPDWWGPLDEIIRWGMLAWLPLHYVRRRYKGPIDHFAIWLGKVTGLTKLADRWLP